MITRLLLVLMRRPRGVALLAMGLVLAGLLGLRNMPVSAIPSVDLPTILVTGALPGASPEAMARLVAAPLEGALGTISGVTEISAVNVEGLSRIVLQFGPERDISAAARDVQAAISTVRDRLPADMPTPPIYQKINPSEAPALFLAVTSDAFPAERLYDIAQQTIVPEISRQPGVGGALLQGAERSAVRIRADSRALREMGLVIEDVRRALLAATRNAPKGFLRSETGSWSIVANDQLKTVEEFRALPIAARDGRVVRLGEVATVREGSANETTAGWFNGRKTVFVFVHRSTGANLFETAASVRATIPRLRAMVPASVDVDIIADRSDSIMPMIEDAALAVALTMVAIALVVVFALRDRILALIAVINVPLSLLGTVLVMKAMGFSLNIISLGGLAVSIGLVVDDAIVVVENIKRHSLQGRTMLLASLRGTQEVVFTIIAITLALVTTLSPLLVLHGPVGAIVAEFAVTVSAAVVISGILSLTLTPVLVARLTPPGRTAEPGLPAVNRTYAASLALATGHPVRTLIASLVLAFGLVPIWSAIPKSFLPLQDTGVVLGLVTARPDTSFAAMAERMKATSRAIASDPAVRSVNSYLGSQDATMTSLGRLYIVLKPVAERGQSMAEVIESLRRRVAGLAGTSTSLQPLEDLRVGGREGVGVNQFTLRAEDSEQLAVWLPRLIERLEAVRSIRDVGTDQASSGAKVRLDLDREELARLGGTAAGFNDALYSAFGQRQVLMIERPLDRIPVVLESKDANAAEPEAVAGVHVSGTEGPIPIGAIAGMHVETAPVVVTHDRLTPAATITFNTAPGYALGDAVGDIQSATASLGLPDAIRAEFAGNAGAFEIGLFGQPITFLLACLAVYLVLGVLYESYLLPLAILSTLPIAALGSLLGLLICGMELTVVAFMGLLLVAGIMMKNAIIMVNFAAKEQRLHGIGAAEAIYRAGTQRFRPIMMTSAAALLGALPIAFATGLGAEFRQPLGIAVAGGLIVAQAVTLYTTPALYILLDRLERKLSLRRHAAFRPSRLPAP